MTKRICQNNVEHEFFERGFKLLGEYKNNHTPLNFICICGSVSTITYKSFRRGSKCMNCNGKIKHTFQTIKNNIEKEGYKLLEKEYKEAFTIMKTICPKGHIHETNWNNFQQGRRCAICSAKAVGSKLKLSFEHVNKVFEDNGCKLLSKKYEGNQKLLKYKCVCGRVSKINFSNFQNGVRCAGCRVDNMSGDKHHNWINDREEARLRKEITTKCFSALTHTLKVSKQTKLSKSFKILGYTSQKLQEHIVNHPNWINVKNKKWHLDHIFPIKAFCDYGITDLSLINCLENLQPLEVQENLRKNAKYNKLEFETWLKNKNHGITKD